MSYVHRIWSTATPTRHRVLPFTLIAVLAFAVSAALLAYSEQPILTQPAAPEIALPRNEASQPNAYWDYVRPEAPAVALPREDASQPNGYWAYLRLSVSGLAVPAEVQEASQPNGYWDYVRPDSAD